VFTLTSGEPISQKLSLLLRFFLRSSVNRSVFIWTLSNVTPGQLVSSISFAASGSNWNAANTIIFGLGTRVCASLIASSTCLCSSGECSGPNEITVRNTSEVPPLGGFRGAVSASAWSHLVPENGSTLVKLITCLFLPLIPERKSSSLHSDCLSVSPVLAMAVLTPSP